MLRNFILIAISYVSNIMALKLCENNTSDDQWKWIFKSCKLTSYVVASMRVHRRWVVCWGAFSTLIKTIWQVLIIKRWFGLLSASQSNTGILRNKKLFNQTIDQCLNGKLSVSRKINFWVEKHSTASWDYIVSLWNLLRFVLKQNMLRCVSSVFL